jgi:hypothetical protein
MSNSYDLVILIGKGVKCYNKAHEEFPCPFTVLLSRVHSSYTVAKKIILRTCNSQVRILVRH